VLVSNAVQLADELTGVKAVVAKDNKLFVNVDKTIRPAEMALVFKGKEYPFEKVEQNPVRRVDFHEELNIELLFESQVDESVLPMIGANVNTGGDWCFLGTPTLQVGFPRVGGPYQVLLPQKMELRNVSAPVHLRGKLANHRAHATLMLTITDLDTGHVQKQTVRFEAAYAGGLKAEHYQNVDVLLSPKFRNLSVQLGIEYRGFATDIDDHQPFLFLAGFHLLEGNPEDELPMEVSKGKGTWYVAKAREAITGLWHCVLRVGDRFSAVLTGPTDAARAFFDERWYAERHPEVDPRKIDYFTHYLLRGWTENRRPNAEFSVREYLLRNPDVEAEGYEPLVHYAAVGKANSRSLGTFEEKLLRIWERSGEEIPSISPFTILKRAQDLMVPMELLDSRKLAVFVVPEHDSMSGGIHSMYSIASQIRRTRRIHGFDVILMTRPNAEKITYIRNSSFSNRETVFRIEQLQLFSEVSELHLYVPEYASVTFVRDLPYDTLRYITRRDKVHINILNQNTRLMPEPEKFRDLRRIADTIGQSVSHHAYFGQEFADYYDLPTLLLPAYTDLSEYPTATFEEKENLILYSDDQAPYREAVLNRLSALPEYRLLRVQGMTFDRYMEYATRCRFSVSFGEGFDGYVAQPIYQGGIGFALYTDEFFPDPEFKKFENFFETEDEMIAQIVPTIRRLESDKSRYEALNRRLRSKWDELYDYEDYVRRIGKLIEKNYELTPARQSSRG
jgi:hypothetical protein